jgi:DMSO/TMAO reductase YedYZ heme-binding membrane subunit
MVGAANVTWLAARSTGVVAWGLVVASMVWGLLLATKVLGRRPAPGALLSLHRFLGALACVFVGLHMAAIVLDSFVHFSVVDVLVPFTTSWRPLPVALGIVALYLLVAVELTSLARSHLPPALWREVHLLSYLLFTLATIHAITAGTDTRATLAEGFAFAIGAAACFMGFGLWWNRSSGPRPVSTGH